MSPIESFCKHRLWDIITATLFNSFHLVHKLRRDPRTLKLDKSEYLSRDRDNDDFYIADKDEPIEKLHAVEMGYLGEQMAVGEGVKEYKVKGTNERYTRRRSRHLLQFETKDLSLDDKQGMIFALEVKRILTTFCK